jgi:cyanophycin synthetase
MYQEAISRGIECITFDDQETILMSYQGKQWYTRGARTSTQSSVGKTIADKKNLTKKILHHFNLPTAKYQTVRNAEDLAKLKDLSFPLVIKPLAERHGKGVVVGIKTLAEAEKHFGDTNQAMLFEEMLAGTEYRIVCINYQFVAAAFRKPAFVTGDGSQTIQQLIDEKNQHPWRGKGHQFNLTTIQVDKLVERILDEQGYSLTDVPAAAKEIQLRQTANLSTGGEAWDVTDQVGPENKLLFEKIAQACDLNIAGIDVMCDSLKTPITDQPSAGVIEVNASPGLRMHHFPMKGEPRNLAKKILDMVMETI